MPEPLAEPGLYIAVLLPLQVLGAAASLHVATRLRALAETLGSPGLYLAHLSTLVFAAALALEALAGLLALHGAPHTPRHAPAGRPEEVALLLANRGTLLAAPLYIVSYTLYASSIIVEHVEQQEILPAAVPLLVQVYADLNLVSLAVLAAAGYTVYTRRGPAKTWLPFYTMLAASHALQAAAGLTASPQALALGLALRALAPLLLYTTTRPAKRMTP